MQGEMDDIGLFDMDGSLADYEGALRRDLKGIFPEPLGNLWEEEGSRPELKATMDLIKRQPGWWRDLAPLGMGMTVYNLAQELGFDCHILTKGPKRVPAAWMEKVEWCQRHLDADVDIHVVSDKKLVYGKFLYDDYPDYMLRWLSKRPRGVIAQSAELYIACGSCNSRISRIDGLEIREEFKAIEEDNLGEG